MFACSSCEGKHRVRPKSLSPANLLQRNPHEREPCDISVRITTAAMLSRLSRVIVRPRARLALGQALLFRRVENDVPVFITKRIVGIAPEVRFTALRETPWMPRLFHGNNDTMSLGDTPYTVDGRMVDGHRTFCRAHEEVVIFDWCTHTRPNRKRTDVGFGDGNDPTTRYLRAIHHVFSVVD